MTFVQVIDCRTSKYSEMNRLLDAWVEQTEGKRTATHSLVGRDHTEPDHYVEIIEFPSYEKAMSNSNLPETNRIFEEMVSLCDGMPTFTDLDVVREDQLNKATARRFFDEVAMDGHLSLVDELCLADYRHHDVGQEAASVVGTEPLKNAVADWRQAFDFRFALDSELAEADRVCIRWTWRGTHRGTFMGIAPTGRLAEMAGATEFRFRDGRIEEAWWTYDRLGLLRQLGGEVSV